MPNEKVIVIAFSVILTAVFLYFHFFAYHDFQAGCHIGITPSIFFNTTKIKSAIRILKTDFPAHYRDLCSLVNTIVPGGGSAGGGNFLPSEPRTIWVNPNYPLPVVAAITAHETCHAKQYNKRKPIEESECYAVSDEILSRLQNTN